jgi:hypothetical protein
MRKTLLKLLILLSTQLITYKVIAQPMTGYIFDVAYCDDASGSNPKDCFEVCPGGYIYIKNLSSFNNSCSASGQNTQPLSVGHINISAGSTTISYNVNNAPGGSWGFNEVLSVPVGANTIISGQVQGAACTGNINGFASVHIKYYGSDASPLFCNDGMDYMQDHGYGKTTQTLINAGPDQAICEGASATLNATFSNSNSAVVTWSDQNGVICNACSTITVSPTTTTTYTASYSNELSCTSVDQVIVTVNALPNVDLGPDQLLCGQTHIGLNAGTDGVLYEWSPSSCVYSQNLMDACVSGTYCVTVTTSAGCTATDCVDIQFGQSVNISILSGPTSINCGDAALLDAIGCSTCTYLWSPDGQTTQSISPTLYSTTNYSVVATNSSGCTDAASQTITVKDNCFNDPFCMTIVKDKDSDVGYAMEKAYGGGYIIVGTMYSNDGTHDADVYTVKYDALMNMQWAYRIGGQFEDNGFSVLSRSDGYYISGSAKVNNSETDVVVIKLTTSGSLGWSYRYGTNNSSVDKSTQILSSDGSNVVVIGHTNMDGNYNVFALKLTSTGAVLGEKKYGMGPSTSQELAYDAIRLKGSAGFVVVGEQYTSTTDRNMLVLRILDDLTLADNSIINNSHRSETAYAVTVAQGGLYIAGTIGPLGGQGDIYVVQLDPLNFANHIDDRYYSGGYKAEIARKIRSMANGDLVITGTLSGIGGADGFVMRIDADDLGNVIWSKKTTEKYHVERFMDFVEEASRDILITGQWGEVGDEDILVSRITSSGFGCCTDDYPVTAQSQFNSSSGIGVKPMSNTPVPYGAVEEYYNPYIFCTQPLTRKSEPSSLAKNTISVFPNPAANKLTVQLSSSDDQIKKINIYDVSGRLITSNEATGLKTEVDVHGLKDGIYFIKVFGEKNSWETKVSVAK